MMGISNTGITILAVDLVLRGAKEIRVAQRKVTRIVEAFNVYDGAESE